MLYIKIYVLWHPIFYHSEDIFPNAVDYYQGPGEDFDIDEDEEIELGSEDESGKSMISSE